jgi:hypothetical protein
VQRQDDPLSTGRSPVPQSRVVMPPASSEES